MVPCLVFMIEKMYAIRIKLEITAYATELPGIPKTFSIDKRS